MNYDVVIVGAGPAGLFAAERLSKSNLKVAVVDERSIPGGAGAITDGKLIFHHEVSMDLKELQIEQPKAYELMEHVDKIFLKHGADENHSGKESEEAEELKKRAAKHRVRFILSKTRHMGSDNTPLIIKRFKTELENQGIEFYMKTKVNHILNNNNFEVNTNGETLEASKILVAPGRGGAYWFREQAKKLGVENRYGPIDVGVRVELAAETFDPVTDISYDAKFHYDTHCHGDRVRTFCVNPRGFVTQEPGENGIEHEGTILRPVNGHAMKSVTTDNTNFAILSTIHMTQPDSDSTMLGRRLIISTYSNGGGKPVAQRWGDLIRGSRSWPETFNDSKRGYDRVKPTLKNFTPGDISLSYYGRFCNNIKEMIKVLDKIIPGVAHPSTILYAPEIKFYDTKYATNQVLETNVPNLFVAGDGCGKSRGIVGAAVSGILAAEGILKKQ